MTTSPADRVTEAGCLFCRIVAGELPATVVHEDDEILALRDIAPRSPTHVLVIPGARRIGRRAHRRAGSACRTAWSRRRRLAEAEGIADAGYRIVSNVGEWGGQTVDHLHIHLMGGRAFDWPPG